MEGFEARGGGPWESEWIGVRGPGILGCMIVSCWGEQGGAGGEGRGESLCSSFGRGEQYVDWYRSSLLSFQCSYLGVWWLLPSRRGEG